MQKTNLIFLNPTHYLGLLLTFISALLYSLLGFSCKNTQEQASKSCWYSWVLSE